MLEVAPNPSARVLFGFSGVNSLNLILSLFLLSLTFVAKPKSMSAKTIAEVSPSLDRIEARGAP